MNVGVDTYNLKTGWVGEFACVYNPCHQLVLLNCCTVYYLLTLFRTIVQPIELWFKHRLQLKIEEGGVECKLSS